MACVLAEAERLYGEYGIPFFTLSCALTEGKKCMKFPTRWQNRQQAELRARNKNAVCVRTGQTGQPGQKPLVVVDADGDAAIATFESLARRAGVELARVPQVQTQRGASGRHYYFCALPSSLASTMRSAAKVVVDGTPTSIDIRAGSNGEGIGCVLAPPTVVTGGGAYVLLPGPAIHEAFPMPDSLASLLGSRSQSGSGALATSSVRSATEGSVGAAALCAAALRDAKLRAGTECVGVPSRVVREPDGKSVRVEFTHTGTRTCPVSRNEHRSNHFSVILRADERTGLPAFFVYCHSAKDGCKASGHRMLSFLREDEADELCADAGITLAATTAALPPTLGQAAVAIGESQKALDRLLENPGGGWATVDNLGAIACALCTASGGHTHLSAHARLMLDGVLDATQLTEDERGLVRRAFRVSHEPLDPIATLRGFAAGLNGKREQELMLIREAIVACTDTALEADVPKAAEALLEVLDYCERRDASGNKQSLSNIADLGLLIYHIWRRVARYGFDKTQSSEAHQWTLYLFNGATYERGQWKALKRQAKGHIRAVVMSLVSSVQMQSRATSLDVKCNTSDFIAKAIAEAVECMQDGKLIREGGLVSPDEFERELDMGNYIGFTNGVYDVYHDRFLPKGGVPLNVLVSMSTNYAYVGPDDARFPEMRAQIEEFYRTLHAEDYANPNDERLAAMWLLAGSLLLRCDAYKKAVVFLGTSNGDNGKTTFTTLIRHTLGDYALGSSAHDPHALIFTLTEGEAPQVKGGRPQVIRQSSLDTEADGAVAVRFGSTFVAGSTDTDIVRRVFPRVAYTAKTMTLWAPYHFLLMLESLREFRQKAECPSGASGYVYCFSSASMPGIVKIGATKRDHSERLREANAAGTWRPPLPYELEGALRFVDAFAVESAIHVRLAPHRESPRREFFRVAPDEVMRLLREYN